MSAPCSGVLHVTCKVACKAAPFSLCYSVIQALYLPRVQILTLHIGHAQQTVAPISLDGVHGASVFSKSVVKLVLLGTAIGEHGVSPGLCNINGELLVNYWLKALGPCPRLQPLASKVYIVTSPETHDHYLDWAAEKQASLGGFPATNLICTGVSRQPSQPLLDLAHALEHIPNIGTGWVVVASLNVFWGPQLPLQQLVERTIVRGKAGNQLVAAMQALTQRLSRPQHGAWPQTLTSNMVAAWWQHVANPNVKTLSYGKDSIVYCRPPPGHSLQGQYEVQLDQQGSSTATGACLNPRVAGIELQPQGASDGLHTCILTPLTLLHKSSLEGLRQAAGAQGHGSPFPPGTLQLGAVVKALLLGQGKPVYCLEVDMCCECISARGLEYASHFLQFMQDEQHKEAKQGPAARALTEVTLRGQACGVIPQTDADVEQLLAQASPLKRWLLRFDVIVDDMLAAQAAAHQAKSSTSLPLDMPFLGNKLPEGVPQRFHTLSTHRNQSKVQHPFYSTTTHDIGRRAPTPLELPDVYAGGSMHFTSTFFLGPYRNNALNTHYTTSRVHKKLDDF
ncbi:hypothetical protein QJQ45_014298 [Haematococcus lacustris]|nr:hypothetical protein QJQ45_014298 [Haematococcus lacustris]